MIKFFLKNSFAIIVGLFALLLYLPFYFQFSHDLGSSSILSEDQQAYIGNIFQILYPPEFAGQGYWDNFLEFAYGPLFWAIPAIAALPFRLVGFEPGMLLVIYFIPFACFAGMLYLLMLIVKINDQKEERLFYRFLAAVAALMCMLSPVILGNTLQIRAEIILSFFSLLSFYFLLLDKNSFKKNYYLSVIFFLVAICIKLLAIFVGIIFLIYFIYNRKQLSRKIIKNSVIISLITIAIGYLPLWLDGGISGYFKSLAFYSSITMTGWPQDHIVKTYAASVGFFNGAYLNFYSLLVLLISALGLMIYKFRNKEKSGRFVYLLSAFAVTLIYLIYIIFVAFLPNNYGILIPIFTSVMIILMLKEVPSIHHPWFKNLTLIIICAFTTIMLHRFVINKTWNFFTHLGLSPFQEKVMKAQNNVRDYLTYNNNFEHPCIDKQLAILKINGVRIDYSIFGEVSLNDDLMAKCDLFIFWSESRVSGFLVAKDDKETNEGIIKTQANYQKILKNYPLIYDKNNIRIFQKK